ncbi:MAG: Sensor histidine kinase LiaS [Verrucomicrobiota bacterium]|jgi:signal transduction histidine kinase
MKRQSLNQAYNEEIYGGRISLTAALVSSEPLSNRLNHSYLKEQDLSASFIKAIESERFRLAHELHDGVGQILTGAAMLTESLHADLSGTAKKEADRILELIRRAMLQVRSLSHLTSPEFLKDKELSQLLIEEIAYWHGCHQVKCHLDTRLHVSDEATVLQLYRITQESIHNAIRHGKANVIQITVRQDEESYGVLEIMNDGALLQSTSMAVSTGIGLRGMKHRAAMIQASLDVENIFTQGVLVTCRFPLPKPRP